MTKTKQKSPFIKGVELEELVQDLSIWYWDKNLREDFYCKLSGLERYLFLENQLLLCKRGKEIEGMKKIQKDYSKGIEDYKNIFKEFVDRKRSDWSRELELDFLGKEIHKILKFRDNKNGVLAEIYHSLVFHYNSLKKEFYILASDGRSLVRRTVKTDLKCRSFRFEMTRETIEKIKSWKECFFKMEGGEGFFQEGETIHSLKVEEDFAQYERILNPIKADIIEIELKEVEQKRKEIKWTKDFYFSKKHKELRYFRDKNEAGTLFINEIKKYLKGRKSHAKILEKLYPIEKIKNALEIVRQQGVKKIEALIAKEGCPDTAEGNMYLNAGNYEIVMSNYRFFIVPEAILELV